MDRSRNFAPTIDNAALAKHFTVFGFTFLLLGKKKKKNQRQDDYDRLDDNAVKIRKTPRLVQI